MRVLREIEFELWEQLMYTEHDSPAIGVFRRHTSSKTRCGSFKTKSRAEKYKQKLVKKYLKTSWRVSKESTSDCTVLYLGNSDIIFWIQEKVVSEKLFRAR